MFRILLVSFMITVAIGINNFSYAQHERHQADFQQGVVNETEPKIEVDNEVCPVSNEKIKEDLRASYEYEGKTYNFCCPACIEEFKKDPQKYIKKIEEDPQKKIANSQSDLDSQNTPMSDMHE